MMQAPPLNLSKRFMGLMAVAILMTVVSAQWYYGSQERLYLEMRLKEKAMFLHRFYSFLISDLLIRKDDVGLLRVVNSLEQDQEVTDVIVVDQKDEVRYDADPQQMGTTLNDPLVKNVLQTGEDIQTSFYNTGGKALALVSPLKAPGVAQPIGVVRIDLTYHLLEAQLASSRDRFWFIILGTIVMWTPLMFFFLTRWVLIPLQGLRTAVAAINPALPEPNLLDTSEDFGPVYASVNDLVQRFKTEWQQQWSNQQLRAEQEKAWIQRLVASFQPDARVIVADKDNRVVSDSGNGVPAAQEYPHLLDLIKDSNFATLLNMAFQKEGEVVRGAVTFQEKNYTALILSVPLQQSVIVKTLITLQPN